MPLPFDVTEHLRRRLPAFEASGSPRRLPGGLLNHVWRVPGRPRPVIVKQAPPYVASQPDIPLDPARVHLEARALGLFRDGGPLRHLAGHDTAPPIPLDLDSAAHTLIMEDLGDLPGLITAVDAGADPDIVGTRLGGFIGNLHRTTWQDPQLARAFDNRAVQYTRREVQYHAVGDLAARSGLANVAGAGRAAEALGTWLCEPGRCLTMGDLWPASVLIDGDRPRLIDWELSHFGQPAQDVAHLAAHLWLHAHRTGKSEDRLVRVWQAFAAAYRAAAGATLPGLLDGDNLAACRTHAGAEILMRAVGPFRLTDLFGEPGTDSPTLAAALDRAAGWLAGDDTDWLSRLEDTSPS